MDEQFQQPHDDAPTENKRPPGLKRTRVGIILSWFFIIAAVVFSQMQSSKSQQEKPGSTNPAQDMSLQMNAKYIVGINSLLGGKNVERFLEQTVKNLHNDKNIRNQICFVPVIAEVSGRESALAELNRLSAIGSVGGGIKGDLRAFQRLYEHDDAWLIEQERFAIEKYGWFGRLALSQGKDASDPYRKAVVKSAVRLLLFLVIFSMAIIAAFLIGLVLLAVAVVFRLKGRLRSKLEIPEKPGLSMLESFAIYITGLIVLPALVLLPIAGFHSHRRFNPFDILCYSCDFLAAHQRSELERIPRGYWMAAGQRLFSRNRLRNYRLFNRIAAFSFCAGHCPPAIKIYRCDAFSSAG